MRVLTIGTFDILHWGHIDFLKKCAELGDLTVGVNSDNFVKTFKPATIFTEDEREHALAALGYATAINQDSGAFMIVFHKPDILAVGSDWARKDYLKQIGMTQEELDDNNIILAYIPYVQYKYISTTEIKRRIRAN